MEEFRKPRFSFERWGFLFQLQILGDELMTFDQVKRKLAAILSADVKGYSRLMVGNVYNFIIDIFFNKSWLLGHQHINNVGKFNNFDSIKKK
jgi:hypothetical protein